MMMKKKKKRMKKEKKMHKLIKITYLYNKFSSKKSNKNKLSLIIR
jgi:hypothetical protein